jgi:membrane protein implicated in regulation of membrane protease activity
MITIGSFSISTTLIWLIVFAVMLVLELFSMGLTTIWFAVGSLVAALLGFFGAPFFVQIIVFVVVSILTMLGIRPLAVKYFNKDREKTNVDTTIGKVVKVTKQICNVEDEGEVVLNGMPWTARSESDEVIEVGEMVTVKAVKGVKLIVEKMEVK